jgi:transcriptional regulator with XRE-family HTH domain
MQGSPVTAADAPSILKASRLRAGLTQAELAGRLGISQAAVAKLESPRANPTVDTLDRALRATGHRLRLDAEAHSPGVDESLIRRHLELSPAERIRGIEAMYAQARRLALAGARSRGEHA